MVAFIRAFICVAFVLSLYGGIGLLTVVAFFKGYLVLAVISGLFLAGMLAMLLALVGLAWSMTHLEAEEDALGLFAPT